MNIRWKFWQRPVTAERLEELQRMVDEAEPGAVISMARAEIKAFKPRPKIAPDDVFDDEWLVGKCRAVMREGLMESFNHPVLEMFFSGKKLRVTDETRRQEPQP